MKKYIFIAAGFLATLTGCKDQQAEKTGEQQRDSLMAVIYEREMTMNEFIMVFNEVERNLDSVSMKQRLILSKSSKPGDLKVDHKAKIDAEIKAINTMMEQNNKKLKALYLKLKQSDKKNVQLEKTVVLLNNQLNNKYTELAEMNEKLRKANLKVEFMEAVVDVLAVQYEDQAKINVENISELHTAYYIIGSSVELQMWGLIDKQGGFLGIGESSKLSNNLDKNMFTKIDYLEVTSIPINSKGVRIVTTHPTGSFSLEKTGRNKKVDRIVIHDPKLFWSASKYLVITR